MHNESVKCVVKVRQMLTFELKTLMFMSTFRITLNPSPDRQLTMIQMANRFNVIK